MVSYVEDRVCETSTSTGTGNFTLAGAVAGFQTFASTPAISGKDFYYLIEAVDTNGVPTGDWETGVGNLSTSTTLVREAPLQSSNSGNFVSFAAGTKRVHLTAPAQQIGLNGCLAIHSADRTAQNFTTATAIAWNNTSYDLDQTLVGFHDTVTNNSRITLPAVGYNQAWVRFEGQVQLANISASDWVDLKIRVDGSNTNIIGHATFTTLNTSPVYQVRSQIVQLSFSDYAELMIQVGTDTSVDLLAAQSWFQLEVLQ